MIYLWVKQNFCFVEENCYWKLVTEIIEKYTPKEDLNDFFQYINLSDARVLPNEDETKILIKNSFFDSVEQRLCSLLIYSYDEVPSQLRNIKTTLFMLENVTLNSKIVSSLNSYLENLQSKHYPMTNELYYTLRGFIQDNKVFSSRLQSFAKDNQIELCQAITINYGT